MWGVASGMGNAGWRKKDWCYLHTSILTFVTLPRAFPLLMGHSLKDG